MSRVATRVKDELNKNMAMLTRADGRRDAGGRDVTRSRLPGLSMRNRRQNRQERANHERAADSVPIPNDLHMHPTPPTCLVLLVTPPSLFLNAAASSSQTYGNEDGAICSLWSQTTMNGCLGPVDFGWTREAATSNEPFNVHLVRYVPRALSPPPGAITRRVSISVFIRATWS